MEDIFGITPTLANGTSFTEDAKSQTILSSIILNHFLDTYVNSTLKRLTLALQQTDAKTIKLKLTPVEACYKFPAPGYTLYPEQDPAFNLIWDILITQNRRLAINNGGTGSGKTALGIALCDKFIKHNLHKPPHIPFQLTYPIL